MEVIKCMQSLEAKTPSYSRFAHIQQQIIHSKQDKVELVVDIKKRLGLTFAFCLSSLPMLAEDRGKKLSIKCNQKSLNFFKKNGCLSNILGIIAMETDVAPLLKRDARIITDMQSVLELVRQVAAEAPVTMNCFTNLREHFLRWISLLTMNIGIY